MEKNNNRASTDTGSLITSQESLIKDERINQARLERFRLLCGNLGWILVAAFLVAFVMFFVLQNAVSLQFRLPWLVFVLSLIAYRSYLLYQWRREPTTSENIDNRLWWCTVYSTLTTVCFGIVGYLGITVEEPVQAALVVMVLSGMVAGATAAFSHVTVMYLLTLLTLMLPVSISLLSIDDAEFRLMGLLTAIYIPIMFGISRGSNAAVTRSIDLRFDNMELLTRVQHEKKRAQSALVNEEKANLAKSRFLAAASHDLRQPLHSLRLFTTTLALQSRDSDQKELVAQITSSVQSLEELFNALLDISRLDAGIVTADKQHLSLDGLLEQINEELTPVAQEKGLSLEVQLRGHVVYTDPLLLERLIRNLLSNAIQYTAEGGVTIDTIECFDSSLVRVVITDTGVGIAKHDQIRMFDEFVQLNNAERDRTKGIGLGLSIVKRLSSLLDINVQVDSSPGQGSSFTALVPAGDSKLVNKASATVQENESFIDLFVLVVENEESVSLAIESLLEAWGCVVMSAKSGEEAISQLTEIVEVPDIIVSDYRLHDGETGGEAVLRIREQLAVDIPAIILTGDISTERLREMDALGLPTLHKPCNPDDLRQLLIKQANRQPANA